MSDVRPVMVPHENVNDEFVTIVSWQVGDGDRVEADQVLAEVEGSKAVFDVKSPGAGFVRFSHALGTDVAVGGVLCHVCATADAVVPAMDSVESRVSVSASPEPVATRATDAMSALVDDLVGSPVDAETRDNDDHVLRMSRRARAMMVDRGLDESVFAGRGLIRERDVLEHLGEVEGSVAVAEPVVREVSAVVQSARAESTMMPVADVPTRVEPLSRMKRTEARYIGSAYRSTLQSAVTVAVPTRGLKAAADLHPSLEGNTTAVIVFEAARLLRKYPVFNACHVDGAAHFYEQVNIGVAMDDGRGLKVPVIREADGLDLPQTADAIRDLLVGYVGDELPVESLAGGTFTVTDLSGEGVHDFHPLINQGQAAILGIGAEFFPPGSREGTFNLTMTFDHQLAEGRSAAGFLNDLASRLAGHDEALRNAIVADESDEEPCCSRCATSHSRLREMNHYLIQTIGRDGNVLPVCTVCTQGW